MKARITILFPVIFSLFSTPVFSQDEPFNFRVVTTGLQFPWEITYGPDGFIWVTERVAKRVTRVHPITGIKTVAVTISEVYRSGGQDGLMGMALHPQLLRGTGSDFVYVAYTYDADPAAGVKRRTKIRRYTYNSGTKTLGSPRDLINNLPASNDHNSGRLKVGPDLRLYYTIGDLGANQFGNKCNRIVSQEVPFPGQVSTWDTKYQGKILRLNLDGSIPSANPLFFGIRSHVYTLGHRNPQGIVFGPDGKLYADEHGPKSDDEINIIRAGKNYGWPHVAGYKDDQAYVYGNWSASSPTPCASLTYSDYAIPPSVPTYTESSFANPDFVAPIKTLFTVKNGYNFQDPACAGNYFLCWPSVAPSSLDIYTKTTEGIPGWGNSLLVISLKTGGMYKLKLSADGNSTVGDVEGYWFTQNRYRDVALNPDGVTFYVSTDNSGVTSGPTTGWTTTLINPGAILEFQYTGVVPDPVVPPSVLFRSAANSLVGQHDTTTITKPVGVVNGDILLAHIYAESDGHAITAPSGWTLIVNVENVPSDFRSAWYWKRATGEGSNYVFTSTGSIWLGGAIAAYSGAIASGNPIDAFGSGNVGGSNTSAVATSITTTVANTLVVFGSHQFHLPPTLTPPAGMTERLDADLSYFADVSQAAAGATGSKTSTLSAADFWSANLIALKPRHN